MSGVEVAELVLAALPLIVSSVEHYCKGLQPFQRWARYEKDLRRLRRDVRLEVDKFLLTFEGLLVNVAQPREVRILLHEPKNTLWHDASIQSAIKAHLSVAYESFCESLNEFYDALFELHSKLRQGLDGTTLNEDESHWDRALGRIKHSLSKEKHAALKQTLKGCNKVMRDLVTDSSRLLTTRRSRRLQACDFRQIRENADSLHDALECGPWGRHCAAPHHASLQLESRLKPRQSPRQDVTATQFQLRFRVLFQSQRDDSGVTQLKDWRETDFVPHEERTISHPLSEPSILPGSDIGISIAPYAKSMASRTLTAPTGSSSIIIEPPQKKTRVQKCVRINLNSDESTRRLVSSLNDPRYPCQNLQLIVSLCATLQEVAEGRGWLGCLKVRGRSQRFNLLAVRRHPQVPGKSHIIRLSDLINKTSKSGIPNVYHLDWMDRRFLTLCLASSVLQLYSTAWLHVSWSSDDILFARQLGDDRKPLIKQPFVSRSFASQHKLGTSSPAFPSSHCPLIRNKTIFDLGVVLIELCFRKPIRSFQGPDDMGPDGKPTMLTDYLTATRMIERVKSKAGAFWANAVRRCIYCEFDQPDTSLDNENFRQAVYQGVVKPLEQDLHHYCGGELPDDV